MGSKNLLINPSKLAAAYSDIGNSAFGTAIVGEVSGSTMSWGSETVFNGQEIGVICMSALAPGKLGVGYQDVGNSSYGTAVIGDVTNSTIAWGSESVFKAGSGGDFATVLLPDKFIVAYQDGDGAKVRVQYPTGGATFGISGTDGFSGQTVPVILYGASNVHTRLSTGQTYFADNNGVFTLESDCGLYPKTGFALSPTELLLKIE